MNKNKNSNFKENKGAKPPKKNKAPDTNKKARQKKSSVSGFSTLNQVAGVPKKHQYHSDIPVPESKTVQEPDGLICPFCSLPIDSIASAIVNPEGVYSHFDCVLAAIKAEEKPAENQTVSYIGSGNFAICEKNEDEKYTIVKKIAYEDPEAHHKLIDFVEELKK